MQSLALIAQATTGSADRWADLLFGLDQTQRFVFLLVAFGCVTGVLCTLIGSVAGTASSIHRHRLDAELKRDMLDRGMNADEIARVIESRPPEHFLDRWANSGGRKRPVCPPVKAS